MVNRAVCFVLLYFARDRTDPLKGIVSVVVVILTITRTNHNNLIVEKCDIITKQSRMSDVEQSTSRADVVLLPKMVLFLKCVLFMVLNQMLLLSKPYITMLSHYF